MALLPLLSANNALAKLTIIPFAVNELPAPAPPVSTWIPSGLPFVAMYNPSSFSSSHSSSLVEKTTTDGLPGKIERKYEQNKSISVTLILDATGASPGGGFIGSAISKTAKTLGGVDVLIAAFFVTTQKPNPKTHKPNVLRLVWGAGLFFECELESATVTYNLFGRDGRPLRATIAAVFKEAPSASSLSKTKNFFSSSDVTKTYVVRAGDTLCNLAQNEYGDESLYLEIANANDLKNYRKLVPGQVLIFPPIKKDEE